MAPKTGKGKGNRGGKGEKKKKEEKVVPSVIDITVVTPYETEVTLKGISTDKILDVRKLIASHIETCHLTNYSLSHSVRGERLEESMEIAPLKPCVLKIVEDEYSTEEQATAHVRRLLDLIACTTAFGKQQRKQSSSGNDKPPPSPSAGGDVPESVPAISERFDMTAIKPAPKLGEFYEFFSLGHVTPPVQFIKRHECGFSSERQEGDYFQLEVKVCNGKLWNVVASVKGFYAIGKEHIVCNSLVDLLQQLSSAFSNAYDALMKAFVEHNKFGNLPYGFRANTWLAPPVLLEPSSLPLEDENWSGDGGGQGRNGKFEKTKWAAEFVTLQGLPCKTEEERLVRDRKAFLLHGLFLDTAIFKATSLIKSIVQKGISNGGIVHEEKIGDLDVIIKKDKSDASLKTEEKVDLVNAVDSSHLEVSRRNLIKGLTADESVIVKDTGTIGVVIVKQCGYTATVRVSKAVRVSSENKLILDKIDQPNGGSNSLNINSLRVVLPRFTNGDTSKSVSPNPNSKTSVKALVRKILEENLKNLEKSPNLHDKRIIRWELGFSWLEHLKKEKEETLNESSKGKNNTVKGLGMHFEPLKKIKKKNDDVSADVSGSGTDLNAKEMDEECEIRKLVDDESFNRLKGFGTGLHNKSLDELMEMGQKYYDDVALPKLVADFASLELSPVDGKTMADFMHMRGLNVCSLGRVVELAEKLPHIQSICMHEMVTRAFKHIVRSVISSFTDTFANLPLAISEILNLLIGNCDLKSEDHELRFKWVEMFCIKRFNWRIKDEFYHLRKSVLLRGLCNKVGLEIVARDYDLSSVNPFDKSDIVGLVPICKHMVCSTADGRNLLESSKTALDKGKLDEALSCGTKALAKMIAVCGPYNRMTANAYSLLAVVLYHTGDFDQATIYQQKALDINERELGLDHPETMKSYGDLSVFYYRLQHIELALKYVNRALYLLQISCGLSHPNSAATYINVAMMEEGMGNVHIALRYLHEALNCNKRLLGPDHIQTAASYHAIAIALSMMDAFSLSYQHEQTTLQILQSKLGPDDLRTQDAVSWLEYFESRVLEQQEAAKRGLPKPDPSISSKGHLSVSDLLDFINPDEEKKEREAQKKYKRVKSNNKSNQLEEEADQQSSKITIQPDQNLKSQPSPNSPTKQEKSKLTKQPKPKKPSQNTQKSDGKTVIPPEEYSDEGWQEAGTKNRSNQINKKTIAKKPILPKLNVHALEDSVYGKKKIVQVPVPISKNISKNGNDFNKPVRVGTMASKSVSYKDVAISPPGTILKPNMEIKEVKKETVKEAKEIKEEEKKLLEEEATQEAAEFPATEDPETESPVGDTDDSKTDASTESQSEKSENKNNNNNNGAINGSKLSASAPPFKPGLKPVPIYDSSVEIGTSLYYGTGFGIKQGFYAHNNNINNNNKVSVMNPNAAEFVPSKSLQQDGKINENEKTSTGTKEIGETEKNNEKIKKNNNKGKDGVKNYEKTELARQILLNFIVKSVRDSLDSSEETGTEKKLINEYNNNVEFIKIGDVPVLVPNEKKKDLEGFTVVSKRRNNNNKQQIINGHVNGLYANHSICTSAS